MSVERFGAGAAIFIALGLAAVGLFLGGVAMHGVVGGYLCAIGLCALLLVAGAAALFNAGSIVDSNVDAFERKGIRSPDVMLLMALGFHFSAIQWFRVVFFGLLCLGLGIAGIADATFNTFFLRRPRLADVHHVVGGGTSASAMLRFFSEFLHYGFWVACVLVFVLAVYLRLRRHGR